MQKKNIVVFFQVFIYLLINTTNAQMLKDSNYGIKNNESMISKFISYKNINAKDYKIDSVSNSHKKISYNKSTFGFKGGFGLWKITSLGDGPDYSYPLGFTIGVFLENQISQKFSIINELFFQSSITSITIYTHLEEFLEQKLFTRYLNMPMLLKYETEWLGDTYVYLGPSFAYLVNAEYNYTDREYHIGGNVNVTDNLPKFNFGIEFGFGEKLELYNSIIFFELRVQINLSKIQPKNFDNQSIGEWRNSGLMFLIGYKL